MSDEGDRACPLCAEEMDLTDQQLKPCKCGYEICVWCWHQIMDMAEKDQMQGRCPACRTPYNKEKVVRAAANCERLVAEMNMEKKMKSQKTKSKISDGRKQLGSVRVIQKSLVYIVGLPLTLADENLLQNRDYFGQYGKVLKVSISRTAAGSIQQFANSTCSVYITYSKEEEAVRCIQAVHGFVLEDRSLRACFGTTKYCHAWLRNMPCSNPDCLYLHEVGMQEDSFSKDESISAYTRNRVQQITGATSNMQLRSGNILPPPADEYHISSSTLTGKHTNKSASNNVATSINGYPPITSPGQSIALPSAASWGARACKGNPPSGNIASSDGFSKQKPESATVQTPCLQAETKKKLTNNEENHIKSQKVGQEHLKSSNYSCTNNDTAHEAPVHITSPPSKDNGNCIKTAPIETISAELVGRSCNPDPENGNNDNLCSGIDLMKITNLIGGDHSGDNWPNNSLSGNNTILSLNSGLQQDYSEEFREPSTSISLGKTVSSTDDFRILKEKSSLETGFLARGQFEMQSDLPNIGTKIDLQVASPRVRQNLQSLEGKKINGSEFATSTSYFSPTQTELYGSSSLIQDPPILDKSIDNGFLLHPSSNSAFLNGYLGDIDNSYLDSDINYEQANLKNKLAANAEQSFVTDMGESNMISNILSLDFDPWEESMTSSQNLVKLLAEGDKCQKILAPSGSWKAQSSNKSRFSFARPDEYRDTPTNVEPDFSHMQHLFKESPLSREITVNRESNFDKFGDCNGFSSYNAEGTGNLAGSFSYLSSSKFSGSRFPVSAPPGFSSPNKAPPPGFASHDRTGPNFDPLSGNHFLDTSSFLRNPYQSPQNGNIGNNTDIEFMDPAILAVGKGRLPTGHSNGFSFDMNSNYSPHLNYVENEVRFQSQMQRSSPLVHNGRFSEMGNGFGPINNNTHNHLPSRIMEQTLASNISPYLQQNFQQPRNSIMSNSQWNGWSEGKNASDMGFNSFYGGYEDTKFRMPSSGDIYNRTYGI